MKKDRIKEIRKGLEKDIYKKVQKLEELEEPDRLYSTKTESLANFLPNEEEEIKTIELIEQEEVELEVNQEDVVKEYNNFIHKEEIIKSKEINPLSTEKIKEEVLGDIENISFKQEVESDVNEEDIVFEVKTQEIKVPKEEVQEAEPTVILQTDETIDKTLLKARKEIEIEELEEKQVTVPQIKEELEQKVKQVKEDDIKVLDDNFLLDEEDVVEEKQEEVEEKQEIKQVKEDDIKELDDNFLLDEEDVVEEIERKNKKSILIDIFLFLIIILLVSLIFYLT